MGCSCFKYGNPLTLPLGTFQLRRPPPADRGSRVVYNKSDGMSGSVHVIVTGAMSPPRGPGPGPPCKPSPGHVLFSTECRFGFQREIDKLVTLCLDRGATTEEVSHCRVRRECLVLSP